MNGKHKRILLEEIIKPYYKILVSKSLNCICGSASEARENAWTDITKKYNSICTNKNRTIQQIKVQWKNIIRKTMKNDPMLTENITQGPRSWTVSPESQEMFDPVQEYESFKVESIDFDSDGEEEETHPMDESYSITKTGIPSTSSQEEIDVKVSIEALNNFKEATTQTCDREDNYSEKSEKNGNSLNFSESFHEEVRYYREIENNRLEKEHLLRVRTMKEQHNQLMKNLQLQEEILKRQLKKLD